MSRHAPTIPSLAPQRHRGALRLDGLRRRGAGRGGGGWRRVAAASSAASSCLHLGQPRPVPRHQHGVVLVGEVAGLTLTIGVGQRALAGSPARRSGTSARRAGPLRSFRRRDSSTVTHRPLRPAARRIRGSGARRGRPPPTRAPAPRTMGMIQMSGTPPASGGTSRMVWPYSDTRVRSMSAFDRPAATMLSIWWRTAMAVVAFDSATERSVHDGQRTPASRAAARWPAVGGDESRAPLPITSATTRTTTGRATRAQSGRRAVRSATGHAGLVASGPPSGTSRGSSASPGRRARR